MKKFVVLVLFVFASIAAFGDNPRYELYEYRPGHFYVLVASPNDKVLSQEANGLYLAKRIVDSIIVVGLDITLTNNHGGNSEALILKAFKKHHGVVDSAQDYQGKILVFRGLLPYEIEVKNIKKLQTTLLGRTIFFEEKTEWNFGEQRISISAIISWLCLLMAIVCSFSDNNFVAFIAIIAVIVATILAGTFLSSIFVVVAIVAPLVSLIFFPYGPGILFVIISAMSTTINWIIIFIR